MKLYRAKLQPEASQKRLALQDSLTSNDNKLISKNAEIYINYFKPVLDLLQMNRSRTVLNEQPQFDWEWGENTRKKHMSSCWIWESVMAHAVGYYSNYNSGTALASDQDYKGASKSFEMAGKYAITISDSILPLWSWKETQGIDITIKDFWESKLYFIYAVKDICTLQFGIASEKGLQTNNILRLLVRAEGFNNKSLIHWFDTNNEALMNWTRTSRALFISKQYADDEKYGKAIGTAKAWENIMEQLIEKII